MPFSSKKQHRWMRANHPEMADRWAAHTKDMRALPESAEPTPEKKGFCLMSTISGLAKQAADESLVAKLAHDTRITPELVHHLASTVRMTPNAFVKAAYADPADYTIFLKVASGHLKPEMMTKGAALGKLSSSLMSAFKTLKSGAGAAGSAIGGAASSGASTAKNAIGAATGGATNLTGGVLGASNASGGLGKILQKSPIGGSMAGRAASGATAVGGVGAAGAGANALASRPGQVPPPDAGPTQQAAAAGANASQPPPAAPKSPTIPPGASQPQGSSTAPGGGGMNPAAKALIAAGGVGLGALGAGAVMRKKKKPAAAPSESSQEKVSRDEVVEGAKAVMRKLVIKTAAAQYRKEAADVLCKYLDRVATHMPLEKTASVRTLQSNVAAGKPLSHAIKLAYPTLNGEQRGILATDLVRKAVGFQKKAGLAPPFGKKDKPGVKTQERQQWSGKASEGGMKMKQMS